MNIDYVEYITNKVLERLRIESIQPDYTIKELSELLQVSEHNISMNANNFYGHYKAGRLHRFCRTEVDYRRRMNLNLKKEC